MLITPVPDVIGEDVGAHAELCHASVLGSTRELAVLHGIAVIEPGRFEKQLFNDVDPKIDCEVAVAVHVGVDAAFVEGAEHFHQLLRWHHPDTVVGR